METRTEQVRGRPSAAVCHAVTGYLGYRTTGVESGTHQGLPGPCLTTVISLAEPVELVVLPDGRVDAAAFQGFVSGLHTAPATIRRPQTEHGIHLDLSPLGARALLGAPAGALAHQIVDLDQLLGRTGRELPERLASVDSWQERFALLDATLARIVAGRRATGPPPDVVRAWTRLEETGGTLGVAELATELGWSRRHLTHRFRSELGLTPKAAARTIRFDRSRRLVQSGRVRSLAQVAAICGYADQAHLCREWRALSGLTPSAWRAEGHPDPSTATEVAIGGPASAAAAPAVPSDAGQEGT